MFKKGLLTVGALLLAGGAVVSAGGVAEAAYSQCSTGRACAWRDADYTGGLLISISSSWSNFESGANDRASSLANRTSRQVSWYTDGGLQGTRLCVNSHSSNSWVSAKWNDKFSSVTVHSTGSGNC